jgi:AcrR family transcriptional regulator
MQRKATKEDRARDDLPPRQTRALGALLGGATITAAAEAAGVERTTIYRWLRDDVAFQGAYNRLRHDLLRELQSAGSTTS